MLEDKCLVFDTISEQFDKWREKYTPELFVREENRAPFYEGINAAVRNFGKIDIKSAYVLDLYQKQL